MGSMGSSRMRGVCARSRRSVISAVCSLAWSILDHPSSHGPAYTKMHFQSRLPMAMVSISYACPARASVEVSSPPMSGTMAHYLTTPRRIAQAQFYSRALGSMHVYASQAPP